MRYRKDNDKITIEFGTTKYEIALAKQIEQFLDTVVEVELTHLKDLNVRDEAAVKVLRTQQAETAGVVKKQVFATKVLGLKEEPIKEKVLGMQDSVIDFTDFDNIDDDLGDLDGNI